jgi:predicted nuclease of restriction endonuclease-like (RecB) superfamily
MKKDIKENDFKSFVIGMKEKILSTQYKALKKVNKELMDLYWEIGKSIVLKQEEFGWGKVIVKNLSDKLKIEFIGMKGFSERNLWNMRNFYIEYKENEKLQTLSAQIRWSHNTFIFQKCKDIPQREFYINMILKFGWSYKILDNQINNKSFEKPMINQTNFYKTIVDKYKHQAILVVKDEYNFDFLELGEQHSEYELEIGKFKPKYA